MQLIGSSEKFLRLLSLCMKKMSHFKHFSYFFLPSEVNEYALVEFILKAVHANISTLKTVAQNPFVTHLLFLMQLFYSLMSTTKSNRHKQNSHLKIQHVSVLQIRQSQT